MKKQLQILFVIVFMCAGSALLAGTEPVLANNPEKEMTAVEKKERINTLSKRVMEIKELDKSNLSRVERKALRKELKDIKKEMKTLADGIYISAGALIIIILLLILIL